MNFNLFIFKSINFKIFSRNSKLGDILLFIKIDQSLIGKNLLHIPHTKINNIITCRIDILSRTISELNFSMLVLILVNNVSTFLHLF